MKGMKYTLTGWLLLCIGLFSCTEDAGTPRKEDIVQPVQVSLELCVPAPTLSRAAGLSEVDDKECALFAFQDDRLLWVRVTDGSADGMYLTGNVLNFTCEETTEPIHLIMLANVGLDEIVSNTSLQAGTPKNDAINALKDITYESELSQEYIPMAGELTLENGISSTTTGAIKLRRSLAKISVTVTYDDGLEKRFVPRAIKIVNANATAAVYAPGAEASIPANPQRVDEMVEIPFDGNGYVEAFVAETQNDKSGHMEGEMTKGIAVLVGGTYQGPQEGGGGEVTIDDCWYRLDMIEDTPEMEEIDYLLRNHHYRFVIRNLNFPGTDEETVLKRETPHNAHFQEYGGNDWFEIIDEEILSITTEYFDDETPYYVGVSSATAQMNIGVEERVVVRVEVVTNHYALKLDEAGCEGFFTFVKTVPEYVEGSPEAMKNARIEGTVWIWENEGVTKPGTYTYYLYCGNIRKQMTIEVIDK